MSPFKLLATTLVLGSLISLPSCSSEVSPTPASPSKDSGTTKKNAEAGNTAAKESADKTAGDTSADGDTAGKRKLSRSDKKAAKTNWVVCATCHGDSGKGDGVAGKALDPKPRDYTDKKWQASVTDEHLFKVIKEGGTAVGLSPLMAPYGHLKDGTVHALVEMVREFGK